MKTDNHAETIRALCAHILAEAPRGLKPRSQTEIERAADDTSGFYMKYLEFARAGTDVTLSIEVKTEWNSRETDADGNEWRR